MEHVGKTSIENGKNETASLMTLRLSICKEEQGLFGRNDELQEGNCSSGN